MSVQLQDFYYLTNAAIFMPYRKLTSIISHKIWVLYMLQSPIKSMQLQNFHDKRGSMEFHATARVSEIGTLQLPWNSMEFHGTACVTAIGAFQVPWSSMDLLVSVKLAHAKFHGIPWNCLQLLCQRN